MRNRNEYPRVTTVLHEGFKDGNLETWAIKMAMKKLQELHRDHMGTNGEADLADLCNQAKGASGEIMRNAARRGTAVHHMIEGKTREELQIEEGDWESVEPMYQSFLLWGKERNFQPIANEVPIWSDTHGFRGTLDCIGWVDGRLELIDWKTSNAIRLDYRMQTAAYWYGLKEISFKGSREIEEKAWAFLSAKEEHHLTNPLQGIRIVRFGGRSDKESQLKDLVQYEELIIDGEEEIGIDFNAFLAAKRLHDWKLKRK